MDVTGDVVLVRSTVVVVVMSGNIAMVHANLDNVLGLEIFFGCDVCAVWLAKRDQYILVWVFRDGKENVLFQNRPTYWAGPPTSTLIRRIMMSL